VNPTSKLVHFKNGGSSRGGDYGYSGSVLGLPIFLDDANQEFVSHQGKWVHVDDMPLEKLHTVDTSIPVRPKRVPVFPSTPVVPPNVPAFFETTPEQRVPKG
jgi:hypothetical protein